jgi:hypothetical protein
VPAWLGDNCRIPIACLLPVVITMRRKLRDCMAPMPQCVQHCPDSSVLLRPNAVALRQRLT